MKAVPHTTEAFKYIMERRRNASFFPSFKRSLENIVEIFDEPALQHLKEDHRVREAVAILTSYNENTIQQQPGWPG